MNKSIYIFLFLLLEASCKKDTLINNSLIKGKWMVTEAHRDGKKTKMMSGAYFYFDDSIISTNYMGADNQFYYYIDKNNIFEKTHNELLFQTLLDKEQNLIFETKIQNVPFTLKLKKE
ncbi:MAG: hypothetical protein IPO85_17355 [Saprospiraceae bacterium]|uniref:Lipocalin-like domain-containing protein n=1 Tax=Candidatus Defluviibacterium haderslevense TaxID=2981993 RepID=A0A9D7XG11_9BACT|nr:hypothetical protein [Candidatus Defluviibacterium haderslevense]